MRTLRPAVSIALTLCVLCSGCNRRVFEKIAPSCNTTLVSDIEVPVARAADILIVVDNSGSMAEEQDELARNFVNPLCPIDLSAEIPAAYKNPSPALYGPGGDLENCGFIQLIAAFDNDFRVGVITTDVGIGDNRINRAPDGWGSRPQRGCLQQDATGGKVIARAQLNDADASNDDFAARFSATLSNVQIYGSPVERGLDAAALFLDPNAARAPGCEDDLAQFRRPDEQLVVLFLTDEEDCSHAYGDTDFPDEVGAELAHADTACVTGADCGDLMSCIDETCLAAADVNRAASSCYTDLASLPPPSIFADRLLALDPRAKVAVIGGLAPDGDALEPAGCVRDAQDAVVDACFPPRGFSASVQPGLICSDAPSKVGTGLQGAEADAEFARIVEERGCTLTADGQATTGCALACCQADPAGRYVDFAGEFVAEDGQSNAFLDSICKESYRDTMLKLAAFIASVDIVKLAAPPADEDLIVVSVTRDGASDPKRVLQIEADECVGSDGFYYDAEQVALVFCGDARLRPGDDVDVRAPGEPRDVDGCALPD